MTVSQRGAATLYGLGLVGEFERRHRGDDLEVAITLFQLKKAAREYTRFHSEQLSRSVPQPATLVSTTQAARILGIERQSVTRRIRNGKLPAVLIGGRWAVSLSDLAA